MAVGESESFPKFEMFLLLKVVVMVVAGLTVVDNDTWACHLLWGCTHNTCHGRYLKERLLLSGVGGIFDVTILKLS